MVWNSKTPQINSLQSIQHSNKGLFSASSKKYISFIFSFYNPEHENSTAQISRNQYSFISLPSKILK